PIASQFKAAATIDARHEIVLPGLINTHTHAPMVMYRGLADDLSLMDWLQKYIFPAEAKTVSPEMVRIGTRLAALEMIESGTTAYADMYYFEEEIAKATREAGLRGVRGQTIIQFPVADAKPPAHGVWVTDEDIQILKNHNVAVSHNPESNMKLASGIAPVTKYLAAGVTVGLGTDGAASNNDLDMFEAMRQAAFLAKLATKD